jgi:hypothetical protein
MGPQGGDTHRASFRGADRDQRVGLRRGAGMQNRRKGQSGARGNDAERKDRVRDGSADKHRAGQRAGKRCDGPRRQVRRHGLWNQPCSDILDCLEEQAGNTPWRANTGTCRASHAPVFFMRVGHAGGRRDCGRRRDLARRR